MWVSEVEFDGRHIKGVLLNQPDSLRSVKEGDRIQCSPKKVVDWLYCVMGEACGGFTIQVMRLRMDKKERKAHDKAWGFEFGEAGGVRLVPEDFLAEEYHGKKSKIPDVEGMFIHGPFKLIDQTEHPMSVNMRESLEEAFQENPTMAFESGPDGLTMLHSLCLAGSLDGVDVCLESGSDPNTKAPNGLTPLQMAKTLGWK